MLTEKITRHIKVVEIALIITLARRKLKYRVREKPPKVLRQLLLTPFNQFAYLLKRFVFVPLDIMLIVYHVYLHTFVLKFFVLKSAVSFFFLWFFVFFKSVSEHNSYSM